MSGRSRLILAIVVAVLVCAGFYFIAVRGRQKNLDTVKAQVTEETTKTQELQLQLAHLKSLQEQAPKLEAQLANIRKLVPQTNEVPNFIFQVQEAANEAGVSFLQITPELPKPPPEGAALAEVRLSIGANGGYFAVQDFLRRLDDLDRALRTDTVAMSGSSAPDGTTTLQLQMATRIFFELPAVTAPATGVVPAPASSPTPAPAP